MFCYYYLLTLNIIIIICSVSATATTHFEFFQLATQEDYFVETNVLTNYLNASWNNYDKGYHIQAKVSFSTLWQHSSKSQKIIKLQLSSVKLHSKLQGQLQEENSKINTQDSSAPILVHLTNNLIKDVYSYADVKEAYYISNLKKAIASLLQFKWEEGKVEENDISGKCNVTYRKIDHERFIKSKSQCTNEHLPSNQHYERLLGVSVNSVRSVLYELNGNRLSKIISSDQHELRTNVRSRIGALIKSSIHLKYISEKKCKTVKATTADKAVRNLGANLKHEFKKDSLNVTQKPVKITPSDKLEKLVESKREDLKADNLGSVVSAYTALDILQSIREANTSEENVTRLLSDPNNKEILFQLLDIIGSAQTIQGHNAVMKMFNINRDREIIERYLWALSLGYQPQIRIIHDLIEKWKNKPENVKLLHTLMSTVAAMTHRYTSLHPDKINMKDEIFQQITTSLDKCDVIDKDNCITMHIQVIKNLKYAESKGMLLQYSLTGSRIVSTAAIKALYSLPIEFDDQQVIKAAQNIYYEITKKYDSTVRTIAIDILLRVNSNQSILRPLLHSLTSNDPSYEVKRYLLKRLQQIAETDDDFKERLSALLKNEGLDHYGALAQRGLSNGLSRTFFKNNEINATLSSTNEISKGIIKRSLTTINLQQHQHFFDVASIDIFASGLNSFMWSDDTGESDIDEPEETTAGIELSVYGVYIRPFVFFKGNAELMSRLWSATVSDRTAIFQVLALLHDHNEQIALNTGNIASINVLGESSYDLSGQMEYSLWNRNAHSLFELNTGVYVRGTVVIDEPFANVKLIFDASTQVNVHFITDLDYSNEIVFCLQVSQLDVTFKQNYKRQIHIRDSDKKMVRKKSEEMLLPGRTYALSQVNHDMCNAIFK